MLPLYKNIDGVMWTVKKLFSMTTLIKNECVEGKVRAKTKSQVSDMIDEQGRSVAPLENITATFSKHDAEIS